MGNDAASTGRFSEAAAEALAYEELWAPMLRPVGDRLLAIAPLDGARRVLDVGTGVGSLLHPLRAAAPDATVVGVDRVAAMVERAPPSFPRAVMDAHDLGLRAGAFDGVVVALVLSLVADPARVLAEAARVLNPGGWVAAATWADNAYNPALEAWEAALVDAGTGLARHRRGTHLVASAEHLQVLLEDVGFAPRQASTWRLEHPESAAHFLARHSALGAGRAALADLEPAVRASCLEQAAASLGRMAPEAFVFRAEVAFAVAHRPQNG